MVHAGSAAGCAAGSAVRRRGVKVAPWAGQAAQLSFNVVMRLKTGCAAVCSFRSTTK